MIELPDDWVEVVADDDSRPKPKPATYICRIIDARISHSSFNGTKRLECDLDINEGDFKDYFTDDFNSMKSRNPETAFWRLTLFLPLNFNDAKNGNFFKSLFRRFTDAVEMSNMGFFAEKNFDEKMLVGKVLGALVYVREKKSGDKIYQNYRVDSRGIYSVRAVREHIKIKPSWIEDEDGNKRDPNETAPEKPKADSEPVEDVDIPFD